MIEFSNSGHTHTMQKFIRQIVLVFRFLYFKFFEGISQFVTPSEAWHDNSDIVWRKKISLNKKKNSVLKVLILIVCWPENGRPLLVPPRNDVWLTRVEISYQHCRDQQRIDQWGVTTQSASDWLKEVSLLKLWIYENHTCELQSEQLFEGRSSQLYTQLMQLPKESLKNSSVLYGIRTLDLCDAGRQRSTN